MREELFDQLVESVKQMKEIEAGRMEPARVTREADLIEDGSLDVAALRARFQLSQEKFAALLGISVGTPPELGAGTSRAGRPREGPAESRCSPP